MSKYGIVYNGKVQDFRYNKLQDSHYAFYIGDYYVGQVIKVWKEWSAVASTPQKVCPVDGFTTRHRAAWFLLKLQGYVDEAITTR